MYFLYEQLQSILFFFVQLLAPKLKNPKLQSFVEGRKAPAWRATIAAALAEKKKKGAVRVFWVHASSAGELEQAVPVARKLADSLNASFFVSYFSPSAQHFVSRFPNLLGHSFLPLDRREHHEEILSTLDVEQLFLVRYDFWP